ncbi:TIP120-domain-containing protein [Auriscalpium vulgare]|uniref:TIP120-domain-containing protein n=1 Tax=Auriscalpium vulgare TaxID=40419 RepID=A0ACB8R8S2_9AGAM|nr:TIP120-domain-containing protein [Auriscalpium vulgare]
MTKTYLMTGFIEKMQSGDQDFRYMGLSDLMKEVKQDSQAFVGDEATELKVLNQVLQLVEDKISEVKNQAVKCLGQLIKILRETQMELVVDKLTAFSSSDDQELRDISGLALKTITSELPPGSPIASKACAKLTPKLLDQLSNSKIPPETLIETLSILSILITNFPAFVSGLTLSPAPLQVMTPLLTHSRPAVRKRAIATLAQFVPLSSPELFSQLLTSVVNANLVPSAPLEKQRTTVNLVAAISRTSPQRIAPGLGDIVPGILKAVQKDDDDLREGSLQALEAVVLKCPSEVPPFLSAIIQAANTYIRYDPNYTGGGDDEDEEMADGSDDEDAELDEYSDEEDTSYKIRRSATKLLGAIIGTRPELLVPLYKEVSPVLISRFDDREETVRLEIWATYVGLLTQTKVYGGGFQAKDSIGVKRKRTPDGMDVEETAYTLLQSQVPALSKVLLHQLKSPKTSPSTLQAGFGLLHTLLDVLPGSLSAQVSAITAISSSVLSHSPTTSTSTLHISCLQFLALLFSTHPPPTFSPSLPTLTPVLLKSLAEKHPRVASETFRVFSALLQASKPVKPQDWVESLYIQSVARLSSHDTDAEVRTRAEETMGDLWICATDVVKGKDRVEWTYICRTAGRPESAVKVVTRVASEVEIDVEWVNGVVDWILTLLRRSGRAGKVEVFECLAVLLSRYDTALPAELPPALVPQLKTYVSTSDIALQSQALLILALLLQLSPRATFPEVEREVLKDVYATAASTLVSGAALDSVLAFFAALVEADTQIATHLVPSLVKAAQSAPKTEASYANVAKCIAQVVRSYQAVAAGVIAEFSKHLKPSKASQTSASQIVLSLLILGEVGRFIDMGFQPEVFASAIEIFAAKEEDVRVAAAFAAGNIAIGNLHQFLPAIVNLVKQDEQKRLLALHALKEVVTHTSTGQLENVAETLWTPLFEESENADESSRNVAAACIGKLITTNPLRYLPQVHARIRDPNPATRATVLSAIRYTFVDSSQSFDDVLAPHIIDFLSLTEDGDLNVRRIALSALNAAARTKPHLIRDHLPAILPNLYKETAMKPELIRTVQMGPWQHKVDDGLEARKTAYETLYTLLDTCLTKLDLNEFLKHVLVGLADGSDEIKVICHMMLFRLSQIAPTAVAQHLGEATPLLEASMKGPTVGKDTVKQDLERAAELQRSTLRAVAALSKIASAGASPRFDAFVAELRKGEWGSELRELSGP